MLSSFRRGALVLYKKYPARVRRPGKKITIELEGDETLDVRPKDIVSLHPGPIESLDELRPQEGEIEVAWELLAGRETSLPELAELAYGEYTPATAWAAWQWVDDGLYFEGTPDEVRVLPAEAVAAERAARQAKKAREEAREAFLARVRHGQTEPGDGRFLRRVEDLALGRKKRSRLLRDLGRAETPQNAHALLLEVGYWDEMVDPYPQRLGLPMAAPEAALPPLPDEPRLDLTHLAAFAIDDEGNREPDDALSLEGDRLWVHIADVAALVPPDSAADLAARERGATLYLPEGQVPMLPWEAIDRLGLGLAEVSPALSFGLDLDGEGGIAAVDVRPSWVRVTRLTYGQAEARLEEEPFASLYHLARQHKARRQDAGSISLELPEVKIRVEAGEVDVKPIPPLRSRDLVTEAMLMAGRAVAQLAVEAGIPLSFATQDPPESDERPDDLAGMFALRRAFRPSEYSTLPGRHAGLGLDAYVQATSPLRRYLDLVVHQQVRAHLRGEALLDDQGLMARLGATAAVSGSLRYAERLAQKHWTLVYLLQHPDWQGEGILVEKRDRRGTVLIPALDLISRLHLPADLALNAKLPLALREVQLPVQEAYFQIRGQT
ncbi:MAG: RNB domain-containing ribonuclease [Anaerolineae bacterium]|jgi:exoribonuclease-2